MGPDFKYYNFAWVHQTIRVTPAMEAGIADHVWSMEEVVGLVERRRPENSNEVDTTEDCSSHHHPDRHSHRHQRLGHMAGPWTCCPFIVASTAEPSN